MLVLECNHIVFSGGLSVTVRETKAVRTVLSVQDKQRLYVCVLKQHGGNFILAFKIALLEAWN